LKVENLVNTFSSENVVAAFDSLRETAPAEKRAEVVESDAGIRRAPQYSQQDRLAHTSLCTRGEIPAPHMSETRAGNIAHVLSTIRVAVGGGRGPFAPGVGALSG
jgi:hypothetical protein